MSVVTLGELAKMLRMEADLVRDILTEKHGIQAEKSTMDLVFGTARKLGYDFKKLKVGKRLNHREEALNSIIEQIENNPKWKRKEIIEHLKKSVEMIKRVHKRTFEEEFSSR
jgi:transcriptional regulator GlxA family with amidase domain